MRECGADLFEVNHGLRSSRNSQVAIPGSAGRAVRERRRRQKVEAGGDAMTFSALQASVAGRVGVMRVEEAWR